jgi:hypothetical protein
LWLRDFEFRYLKVLHSLTHLTADAVDHVGPCTSRPPRFQSSEEPEGIPFDSPPGPLQYVLYVRNVAAAASFTAYVVPPNKATLSMEQLKQVAKIAATRM